MYKISTLLLSIVLIAFTGCEEKKPDEAQIPIENTIEFVSQVQDNLSCENTLKIEDNKSRSILAFPPVRIPKRIETTHPFMLLDTKNKSHKVNISDEKVLFQYNLKSIVIINFFATWCPPCMGQLSSLNKVQKKYHDKLLLIGVLTHDSTYIPTLKSFIAKQEINYYISNSPHNNAFAGMIANTLQLPKNFSIPLTVIYVEGKYYTHYEGVVPFEMIEYDIKQAQKQLKLK